MKLATATPAFIRRREYFVVGVGGLLLLIAALVTLSYGVFGVSSGWTGENGVLELAQQVLLAVAGLVFAASIFLHRNAGTAPERSLIFAALCVTFLLRETDVADPSRFTWLSYWLDETGKKLLLSLTWLMVLFFTFTEWPWPKMVRRNTVFDATFWLLAAAALLLSVSWAIDREHFLLRHHVAVEEISEVIAYGLMLLAALQLCPRTAGMVKLV